MVFYRALLDRTALLTGTMGSALWPGREKKGGKGAMQEDEGVGLLFTAFPGMFFWGLYSDIHTTCSLTFSQSHVPVALFQWWIVRQVVSSSFVTGDLALLCHLTAPHSI